MSGFCSKINSFPILVAITTFQSFEMTAQMLRMNIFKDLHNPLPLQRYEWFSLWGLLSKKLGVNFGDFAIKPSIMILEAPQSSQRACHW